MSATDKARDVLLAQGYKWTGPRREIIKLLLDNIERHVSAEELYSILQAKNSEIGLATVYRTLELLAEIGFIHKLNFGDGCSRYELADGDHHHPHLICTGCAKVLEVEMDLLETLEQQIEREYSFAISGHHLKFFGLCQGCQQEAKEDSDEAQ